MPDFDLATSGTVDTLDTVPEQFRSLYAQGDGGKFVIGEMHKGVVEAVTGLSKALKAERGVSNGLKSQKDVGAAVAEALKDFGITDLDTAKAKLSELTEAVAKNSKVDPAKIKAEIEATFASERTGFEAKVSKMQATLDKHLVENAALSALSAHKGSPVLLLPAIKNAVKVVADGEDYVVRVLDGDGQYRGDGKGGFMSVEDYVKELKSNKDYAAAFTSDTPSGGGPRNQSQSRQQQQSTQRKVTDAPANPQELVARGLAARHKRQ